MAEVEQNGFISLNELAGLNTDDVKAIASRVATPGVFTVEGLSVKGTQGERSEDGKPPITRFSFKLKILGGKPTDKSVDIENLIGREITQSYSIFQSDQQSLLETLGLLKGMYAKIGLPNSGMPMGGVEGLEPGWLDTVVGKTFDIRIRNAPVNGETRAFFDWLPPEKPAAATLASQSTGA
jgi:hypothetical protein